MRTKAMKTAPEIKKIIVTTFLSFLFFSLLPQSLGSIVYAQIAVSSWPMYGNNPQHTATARCRLGP